MQALDVPAGQRSPALVHRVEATEQHAPNGRLNVVKAQVEPHLGMDVLVEAAMVAQAPAVSRDLIVVRHDDAPVSHHREVF